MFALVDVNSFYASCETVFRPDLKGRPVVVLSNNDGCVIARSAEAKEIGITMGEPFFKQRDLFRRYNVATFSSNYELYADMSNRVMTTLEIMSPRVEIYSIDEAFCDLTGVRNCRNLEDFGKEMLGDFFSQGVAQLNLFDDAAPRRNSAQLMEVLDHLNAKGGKGTLFFAGQGIQQQWQMKRDMLSPRYTTRFSDLLRVK